LGLPLISGEMKEGIPKSPLDLCYYSIEVQKNRMDDVAYLGVIWSLSREVEFYGHNGVLIEADIIRPLCAETYSMQTIARRWTDGTKVIKYLEKEFDRWMDDENLEVFGMLKNISSKLMVIWKLDPNHSNYEVVKKELTSDITRRYQKYVSLVRIPLDFNAIVRITQNVRDEMVRKPEKTKEPDGLGLTTYLSVLNKYVDKLKIKSRLFCPGLNFAYVKFAKREKKQKVEEHLKENKKKKTYLH